MSDLGDPDPYGTDPNATDPTETSADVGDSGGDGSDAAGGLVNADVDAMLTLLGPAGIQAGLGQAPPDSSEGSEAVGATAPDQLGSGSPYIALGLSEDVAAAPSAAAPEDDDVRRSGMMVGGPYDGYYYLGRYAANDGTYDVLRAPDGSVTMSPVTWTREQVVGEQTGLSGASFQSAPPNPSPSAMTTPPPTLSAAGPPSNAVVAPSLGGSGPASQTVLDSSPAVSVPLSSTSSADPTANSFWGAAAAVSLGNYAPLAPSGYFGQQLSHGDYPGSSFLQSDEALADTQLVAGGVTVAALTVATGGTAAGFLEGGAGLAGGTGGVGFLAGATPLETTLLSSTAGAVSGGMMMRYGTAALAGTLGAPVTFGDAARAAWDPSAIANDAVFSFANAFGGYAVGRAAQSWGAGQGLFSGLGRDLSPYVSGVGDDLGALLGRGRAPGLASGASPFAPTGRGQSLSAASAWDPDLQPGRYITVFRTARSDAVEAALEAQGVWSGLPYRWRTGSTIALTEYQIDNLPFDDATFDQFGSLARLEEFKWSYSGSIARGSRAVADRLIDQATRQLAVADEHGVPLRWTVADTELPYFQNALGEDLSSQIEWSTYPLDYWRTLFGLP